jgi:tetratricopeptide (TPR) repeat protein
MALFLALLLLAATDFNEEGRKALEARNYTQAVEHFTKAVEADAKDYAARFHLALALSLLDRDAEAIPHYEKVLELQPGLYQAELNLGMLLLRGKKSAEAAPHLTAAAGKKPGEFRPQFYAAEALLQSGDPLKAEAHYRSALSLDPKSAASELGLARSLAGQNRLTEAQEHFRKAAELDPAYKDALLELAALLEKAGKPAEAIAIYDQFPENQAAQERVAGLLIEMKRFDEAAPRLEQALKADPRNYDLYMIYGRVLRDQRNFDAAARQFWSAIQLRGESREAWNELAAMLILLENWPQALAALDRAGALGEETPAHHYFRALILDKNKQYKPALESYQRFLATSQGKNPDEEFKARQRVKVIQKELSRR